jgi:hypothetical protein
MDLNPVIVHRSGEGLSVVDARIILGDQNLQMAAAEAPEVAAAAASTTAGASKAAKP